MEKKYHHTSVMPNEILNYLNIKEDGIYIDGTIGGFGHSLRILSKLSDKGTLIGIDKDQSAILNAEKIIKETNNKKNIILVRDDFANLPEILNKNKINATDGIILDLGTSLYQIKQSNRGFSFMQDEELDMRMDLRVKQNAKDYINSLSQSQLTECFFEYGQEAFSKKIAAKIVEYRKHKKIEKSLELVEIIEKSLPLGYQKKKKRHPATKVFQALRILVNNELKSLEFFLDRALDCLNTKGRLCVISFHSLEDSIVKKRFRYWESECVCPKRIPICTCNKKQTAIRVIRKGIKPSGEEIKENPMSRSAILRVAEKV